MRVVFMGTPEAAVPSLEAVAQAHHVVAVYTQPDRPRGRGRTPRPSPVKLAADRLGLEVVEPASLKRPEETERLRGYEPEIVVVVAFGQILPPSVLSTPRLGCVNVHFSLLPRWRGAAPVARALMEGDTETGVTTMTMDEGLDTGPILLAVPEPIAPGDTTGTLTDRLARRGASLLVETLAGLEDGSLEPTPQPEEGVTYAHKIDPAEAELDFARPAERLADLVRGLSPRPGAHTGFRGQRLKVLHAEAASDGGGAPGTLAVDDDGVPAVAAAEGRLRLLEVQPAGKRPMPGDAFANGYRPEPGEQLGDPA